MHSRPWVRGKGRLRVLLGHHSEARVVARDVSVARQSSVCASFCQSELSCAAPSSSRSCSTAEVAMS